MSPRTAPRVAVAGVFHETNTFAPRPTGLAEFGSRWLERDRLQSEFAGTRTVVGGFLDGAAAHGLVAVPVFGAYATPAGRVTAEALAALDRHLRDALAHCGPFDAVLLELHGAMAAAGSEDPEQQVVAAVRQAVGSAPVACVLDLHANLGRDRLREVDILVGYRTNPHVDTYERGRDAVRHLVEVLAGRLQPVRVHRGVPLIAAPVAQRTDAEPLLSVLARAGQREAAERLVDVTVHAGYAYADVGHLGMGVSVTADRSRAQAAERVADELAGLAWQRREQFRRDLPAAGQAFADAARGAPGPPTDAARQVAGRGAGRGPVVVADTGDNINGGAPGDATWLLAQALVHPSVSTLATLWDPSAVMAAMRAGTGARLHLSIGGRAAPGGGEPLRVDATVRWIGAGTFVNQGPMASGVTVSMGPAAVLRIAGTDPGPGTERSSHPPRVGRCDVVVQSLPVQPNDPELFRCVGLDPAGYDVVLLKGAAALRAGWAEVAARFVDAGTPGVTDSRVERLAFTRAPDGLWPLTPA